ncbi:MAG: tetratricopeptide repeat protein, partial [Armatimonadetes bacterium]|nr:tetratricopeptide repeat protein [Armatimonadota bacterium]
QAAASLQRAAHLRPDDFGIWHDLGQAYLKANAPAESVRAYKRALEIRPNAELALTGLAEAASQAGDAAAALEPLRALYARSPKDVGLAGQLASALVRQGKVDEALQVCRKIKQGAPKVKPGELWGRHQLRSEWLRWSPILAAEGDAYRAKGRWSEAIVAYQRCLLIDSTDPTAFDRIVRLPAEIVHRRATHLRAEAPRFSPDGRRVASVGSDLYAADVATGEVWQSGRADGFEDLVRPIWSPDGRRLCCASGGKLYTANLDGSGYQVLMRQPPPLPQLGKLGIPRSEKRLDAPQAWPAWSPNGKAVAFRMKVAPDVALTFVVDVKTGKARSVHHAAGPLPKFGATDFAPAWSPDGRVLCGPLLYRPQQQAPGLTVWSADAIVKRQIALPREGVALAGPALAVVEVAWSPDVRYLAALLRQKGADGRTVLALVPASERQTARVLAKDVAAFRWLDASHVWLLQRTGDSYVTAGVRALVSDLRGNLKPDKQPFPILPILDWDLSRDRRWLAICAPGGGKRPGTRDKGLWVFDLRRM